MVSKFQFTLGGRTYRTKKAAMDVCKKVINSHPLVKPFASEVLSDLVQRHHYYCSRHGLRPLQFRKIPRARGGYRLEGWFDGIGWHGVSYRKCLTPPTFEQEVNKALRKVVEPVVWRTRDDWVCEKCGGTQDLEQDHVEPKFVDVFNACMEVITDEDRAAWDNFNWPRYEEFFLPKNSPAVKLALKMHENAVIRTLCAPCHRNVKRRIV